LTEYPASPLLPPLSSVKIVLASEFKLLREDDGGNDEVFFYVTKQDSPLDVFDPVNIFLKAMQEARSQGQDGSMGTEND
jgi:hypothetical protein